MVDHGGSAEIDETCSWPPCDYVGLMPPLEITTATSVVLSSDRLTASLLTQLVCGGAVLTTRICWSTTYEDEAQSVVAYRVLLKRLEEHAHLATATAAFGRDWLDREIAVAIEVWREQEALRIAKEAQRLEAKRLREEQERSINAFYRDHERRKRLSLERKSAPAPIWTIDFNEAWERERFWDWLKWQTSRFEEFAGQLEGISRFDLEKLLLAEMLRTEADVKKQGLGSGGRRPMRFWRG